MWLLPGKAPSWATTGDLRGTTAHSHCREPGDVDFVRQQVIWAVPTQPMLPFIFLETLLDCSQFQNKQGGGARSKSDCTHRKWKFEQICCKQPSPPFVVSLLQLRAESPDNLHHFTFSCSPGTCKSAYK